MIPISDYGLKVLRKNNLHVDYNNNYLQKRDDDLTLDSVVDYFNLSGVVGEESLIKKSFCSLMSFKHLGIEGNSGTGKTFIANTLLDLFPDVYAINQLSDAAVFYDSKKINSSKYLYIPELQKVITGNNNSVLELIKDLGEGKVSTRLKTNASRNGVDIQKISPLTIVYTLATENNYEPDVELSRRFIRLQTDNSKSHIGDILEQKAKEQFLMLHDEERKYILKSKIKNQINNSLNSIDGVMDPFSRLVYSQFSNYKNPLIKSSQYSSLISGLVKFDYKNHVQINFGNKNYLLSNLQDHLNINNIIDDNINLTNALDMAKKSFMDYPKEIYKEWLDKQF